MNLWKPVALFLIAGIAFTANTPAADAGGICHDQPNMSSALTSLRSARGSLERAEHDKGGWRAAAVRSADEAIKETERGCAFADK
jgi:hypothetical protein